METKKQPNRIYLTPEQRKENTNRSKQNWYQNNKQYFRPGGRGYEIIMRKTLCPCGREVYAAKLKRHQGSRRCTINDD